MPFEKGKSGNPETQIKKGEVRNPNGRPKGKNTRTIIKEYLSQQGIDNPSITVAEEIILAAIEQAKNGNIRAFQQLIEQAEGKPTQEIKFSVDLEGCNIDLLTLEQQKVFIKLLNISMGKIDNDGTLEVKPTHLKGN